jgi:Uma2 family endonuclease
VTTVDEFLAWEDGTDTRYELVDGVAIAMAPPVSEHRTIVVNAGAVLSAHLRRRPSCHAEAVVPVRISDQVCWLADLAVTRGWPTHAVDEPLLVVEILSPSTRAKDLDRKLRDYKGLASVREIWLVDSEARWVQVWRRQPDGWIGRDHIGGGSFRSAVLEEAVALDELYLNTGL